VRLHDVGHRRRTGLTLVEGPHLVADVSAFGAETTAIYALEGSTFDVGRVTEVSPAVLAKLAGTKSPRGPIAVVRIPETAQVRAADSVVLWDVGDPGNVGAIIRSAAVFGFDVVVVGESADVWSPKAIRSAAASQFATRVSVVSATTALPTLRETGLTVCATVPDGGVAPGDITSDQLAVVIGNEAHGLPEFLVDEADVLVTIPMAGKVESLNAAVSAGIVLHALAGR